MDQDIDLDDMELERNTVDTQKLDIGGNRLQESLDYLNAGIWMQEYESGRIVYASHGFGQIMQVPLSKIFSETDFFEKVIIPSHREKVLSQFRSLIEKNRVENKCTIHSGDGKTKWVYLEAVPLKNEEGKITHLFGILEDISDAVEMEERLDYIASYDSLTGLRNQKSLYGELDLLCEKENPFAVLYLDIDRFNLINDSVGHQIGDQVLKSIATRLTSIIPSGGYIARINSDNFIIILKQYVDKNSIFRLAEKIMNQIKKPLVIDEYELFITTSMGIVFFPEDGSENLKLLENAHAALKHAKKRGKNNYQIYASSRDISSYKKYVLEKDMRKALVNEEFEIYYQPQVDTNRGTILGAEALLRWKHDEWGMVSPGEFIPLAEENHLIHPMTDWVIREICKQLRDWKNRGFTLQPISINISPIRFLKKGLVDYVKKQLEHYQIPAKYIVFEITEGFLLKKEATVLSTIKALRNLGIKIALDDFGTGYSSLYYVKEFDVDIVKIDKAFIDPMDGQHKKEMAIVSSILHLAKGLELDVIAEGVEEYEQYVFLKQKECELIQGYLFSAPVPLKEYEKMMATRILKPSRYKFNRLFDMAERRKYYRLEFPHPVLGEMTILEVKGKKVSLGATKVLIEDVSLGGLKILSSLKLPINADIKYQYKFKLMKELFEVEGILKWKNEDRDDTFIYGVEFQLDYRNEEQLARIVNKMSTLHHLNQEIPETDFLYEDPYVFLKKDLLQ